MDNASPHNEKELLLKIAEGDEKAFTELVKQYTKLLYSFLYEHTDSAQLADDLVQDIFTKLWITRETLTEIKNFSAYLFTLAHNHAMNEIKRRIRESRRNNKWEQTKNTEEYDYQKEVILDIIDRAIEQLPAQQQKVWLMSRRQNMKYREIAATLGISQETVKKYLQYANASIAKYLLSKGDIMQLGMLALIFFKES